MAKKGEKMSPELAAKMAEARREARERKLSAIAYGEEGAAAEQGYRLSVAVENDDLISQVLTADEQEKIREEAARQALEEQHKALVKAFKDEELRKARRALGETPADEVFRQDMEEMTRIFVQLPSLRKPTGGVLPPDPIVIDQVFYPSGRWYTVPKAQAIYMQWLMNQAEQHVNQVDGRPRAYYNAGTGRVDWGSGPAGIGASAGVGFDALHKRPAI